MKTRRFAALFLTLSLLLCTLPATAAEGDDWLVPRMRGSTAFTDTAGTICETAADICCKAGLMDGVDSRHFYPESGLTVRNPDMDMEERYFADAARSRMDYEYSQYLRNQGTAAEETVPEQSEPSVVTGQRIYLSMEAAESAAVSSLLDTLDRYDAQAAFYCTAGFLEEAGDLLRRMSAAGQAIGLIADAADDRPVTEQLEAGNRLLSQAASVKTRLAWIRNATAEAVAEAEAAGFC